MNAAARRDIFAALWHDSASIEVDVGKDFVNSKPALTAMRLP
jgi:hypothetical protein